MPFGISPDKLATGPTEYLGIKERQADRALEWAKFQEQLKFEQEKFNAALFNNRPTIGVGQASTKYKEEQKTLADAAARLAEKKQEMEDWKEKEAYKAELEVEKKKKLQELEPEPEVPLNKKVKEWEAENNRKKFVQEALQGYYEKESKKTTRKSGGLFGGMEETDTTGKERIKFKDQQQLVDRALELGINIEDEDVVNSIKKYPSPAQPVVSPQVKPAATQEKGVQKATVTVPISQAYKSHSGEIYTPGQVITMPNGQKYKYYGPGANGIPMFDIVLPGE